MAVASLWCGRPTMVMPSTRTCYGNNQHIHACSHLRLKLGLEIHGFVSFLPCKSQRFPSRYVKLPQSVSASLSSECSVARPPWQCIVLDIEGTTTPISFVTDVLFPYAHESVHSHLALTYDSKETQDDIRLLREQVQTDIDQGVEGIVPIPSDDAGKDAIIQSLVTNVEAMIKADRKVRALKELQGHIWRTGFQKKDLQSVLFDDVYDALKKWHQSDIKIYIYSSGSREAQKLIFANTIYGDLRKYLCEFFDTKIGYKRETQSFSEIFQYVGVDTPTQILFITDVYEEALAAKAAGLQVMVSIRPGNAPLPEGHGFKTIRSFAEI